MCNRVSRLSLAFCLFGLAFLLVFVLPASTKAITLPADFEDALVATVGGPTALAFTPDGRLLITTQGGRVRVYQNGALLATAALDISARVCTNSERGILGVAVDPIFSTNRYVYLYYTSNNSGTCVNRVSRFVLSDTNTISSTSETVLIDNIHSPAGNHNGGDLHFGKDNLLYISVGDGGCDYANNSGCAGGNDAARDRHVMLGKILRITRDGAIPATNPYQGANSGRCNVTGSTTAGNWCQETFASGLRNPFRIAFDSNAAGTRFFINDVGQGVWEEIDEGIAGADYGWNIREGHCANNSTTSCTNQPTITVNNQVLTNPVFDYQHTSDCTAAGVRGNSITGGAFVPNGVWSVGYDNSYLVGEYVCGKIFKLTPNGNGGFTGSEFATGLGGSSAVAMIFGPYQTTKALYYTTYASGGQVRRIRYTGAANRNPVASFTANPTSGAAPLNVTFNASASNDPDNDTLSYSWDFGDGTTGTGVSPVHQYATNGTYTATLTVSDGRGGTNSTTARIDVGNSAPQPTIISPTSTKLFRVGETITLQGSASDAQDGNLPNNRLTWEVLLHHNNDHTHPYLAATTGNNITFTAPAPEDLAAATGSFLEIRLTATDSQGLSSTITQNLQPRKVNITLATNPTGLNLTVNGTTVVGPGTFVSWDGYVLNVNAPNQTLNNQQYTFQSWSDGGAAAHAITTPAAAATYTATFQATGNSISGTVSYGITPAGETTKFVPGVNLSAAGSVAVNASTAANGNYLLSGLGAGSYTVTPSKAAQTTNDGISLQDASEAAKIAFNQNPNATANQRTAADATGDGTVSLQDASEIAKRSFNITSTNIVGQWKFVPPQKVYASVASNQTGQNYEAILVGDVTGNWTPPPADPPTEALSKSETTGEDEPAKTSDIFSIISITEQQRQQSKASNSLFSGTPTERNEKNPGSETAEKNSVAASVSVSLPNASGNSNATVLIPVTVGNLSGQNVTAFDFTVSFDPNILQPAAPVFDTAGTLMAAAGGYSAFVDPNQPAGRVRIGAFGTTPLSGQGTLIFLRFTVVNGGTATSTLKFEQFIFGEGRPQDAQATITNGSFMRLGSITAPVAVSGRILSASGKGVSKARVIITDTQGRSRITLTNPFGYYRFINLSAGESYTFEIKSKQYNFSPQMITVTGNLENLNFSAQ